MHRRVALGEAVALRVLADVGEAQRLWIADQHAEHAAAARQLADRLARLLVDPEGQEALERGAPLVEDPERRVAGAGDLAGGREDPVEDGLGSSSATSARPAASRLAIRSESSDPLISQLAPET